MKKVFLICNHGLDRTGQGENDFGSFKSFFLSKHTYPLIFNTEEDAMQYINDSDAVNRYHIGLTIVPMLMSECNISDINEKMLVIAGYYIDEDNK